MIVDTPLVHSFFHSSLSLSLITCHPSRLFSLNWMMTSRSLKLPSFSHSPYICIHLCSCCIPAQTHTHIHRLPFHLDTLIEGTISSALDVPNGLDWNVKKWDFKTLFIHPLRAATALRRCTLY